MIRVMYVISSLKDCGPVTVLYNIVKFLDRRVFEPTIITLSVKNNERKKDFQKFGIKVYEFDVSRNPFLKIGLEKVIAHIDQLQPQIIHTQCFRSTLFMSNITNKKLCVTLHCVFFQDFVMTYGRIVGNIMSILFKHALKKYDKVIACSKSISDILLTKYGIETAHVRNGIAPPEGKYAYKNAIDILRQRNILGLPTNKKILVCSGCICKRKNQIFLLQFEDYLRKNDICVVFLGDGEEYRNLSKKANETMYFLGNVNNVYDYLMVADGFVSASLSEGMPNAVLEALMMGLPCLLSDIPSHREIHEVYPDACMLFSSNNENMFLNKLDLLNSTLNSSYNNFSYIREKSISLFSARDMSNKYQTIYKTMV